MRVPAGTHVARPGRRDAGDFIRLGIEGEDPRDNVKANPPDRRR